MTLTLIGACDDSGYVSFLGVKNVMFPITFSQCTMWIKLVLFCFDSLKQSGHGRVLDEEA